MIAAFLIWLGLMLNTTVSAQSLDEHPKQEVRAAWITTAYGLDWPKTRATSADNRQKQQQELIEMLDKLKAAHFNTILFQVRTRGEVFYN